MEAQPESAERVVFGVRLVASSVPQTASAGTRVGGGIASVPGTHVGAGHRAVRVRRSPDV